MVLLNLAGNTCATPEIHKNHKGYKLMKPTTSLSMKLLPSLIATVIATGAHAQNDAIEEIFVSGVRSAQEKAIDIKRNSAEVVDSISSEDIGKLPDSTISDSLQRITGVQIARSAGQGGLVSIRGSREVLSTLNGELFLTAENILNSQANYTDVPAALISGANVSKSSRAKQLEGGIGGSIDLLTRRSLTLDEGFSASVRVQGSHGSITEETDPEISGLLGINWNDQTAMSVGFSYADQTLSDNAVYSRAGEERTAESWGCDCDLDGDGAKDTDSLMMMAWNGPQLYNRFAERERLGLTYNFNSQLSDALELNIDMFYNTMDERASGNILNVGSEGINYNRANITQLHGVKSTGDTGLYTNTYATGFTANMYGGVRAGVDSDYVDTSAFNNSIELKYDNGGAFTGSVRLVSSRADREQSNLDLAQSAQSPGGNDGLVYNIGGDTRVVNPGWIEDYYPVTFTTNKDNVNVTFDETLANRLAQKESWYVHSAWLEGETHKSNLDVLRFDGNFKLADEGITSIDFGMRRADRDMSRNTYHYFMDTGLVAYEPNTMTPYNMLVKYHEAGYVPNVTSGGQFANYLVEVSDGVYDTVGNLNIEPVRGINFDEAYVGGYVHMVNDMGAVVDNYNLSIPMVDVSRIGNHKSFMDNLYDTDHVRKQRPDASYSVAETRESFYISANFESSLTDLITLTGNAGVRHVTTDITVERNITDGTLVPDVFAGADPNHTLYQDQGDEFLTVSHSHFLPSVNANFLFGDSFKVKLSYDERTSLQSLNNFGEASSTTYSSFQTDPDTGATYQAIQEVKRGGNPYLDPWSAKVYNLATEYYPSDNALLGLTFFYMDIGGFVDTRSTSAALPDSDGVVRNGATVQELVNGENATVEGVEFTYQQSFDFLPGFLANTGLTFNYTYSPSTKKGWEFAADGEDVPFNETAKNQSNMVIWYNDDRFEFRVAANYLGKRYDGQLSSWTTDPLATDNDTKILGGLDRWEDETLYVDLNSTYHVNDAVDINLNVQNLTEEGSYKYIHWSDFRSEYHAYERRITLGVNAKF